VKATSFEALVEALRAAEVRYLVAGGLAVVAHGYLRFTKDVDLVIELGQDNVVRALEALAALGYRPHVPVDPRGFADPRERERWIAEKGLVVLNFYSDLHRETPVDVFVAEPFPFDEEYEAALAKELQPGLPVRFVRRATLIHMKRRAGRAQDLADAEQLELRQGEP
jgi:hypothetical protein